MYQNLRRNIISGDIIVLLFYGIWQIVVHGLEGSLFKNSYRQNVFWYMINFLGHFGGII